VSIGTLVLGGAGFIGTHLLRRLADRGTAPLISLDLKPPAEPVAGVDYRTGDVRETFDGIVPEPVERICNLAAVHRTPGHPDHEYYETNVAGAVNACGFARRRGVGRMLFTSSISVYGTREEACDEDTPPAPNTAYGRSKALAELVHREWAAEADGRRLVVVRGRGENGNFSRLLRQLRRRAFAFPGRRDTVKACGWVDELLRSLEFAEARDAPVYLYNFAYPGPTTIGRIAAAVADAAGVPAPRLTVPAGLMLAAAAGFEALDALGLRNAINRDRVRKLMVSTDIRPTRLLQDGYEFETDIESGVRGWLEDGAPRTS
jgi:nucleoside-diphosphate-sugar epimerase